MPSENVTDGKLEKISSSLKGGLELYEITWDEEEPPIQFSPLGSRSDIVV